MGLWALVGAALLVSLAGVLSFGLFTYPLAVAGVVVVAFRPGWMRGLATMVSADAVGLLLVAWLNREGPGRVCYSYPVDGVACSDPLNPWPLSFWSWPLCSSSGRPGAAMRRLGRRRGDVVHGAVNS